MDKRKTSKFLNKWSHFIFTSPMFVLILWEFFVQFNLINKAYFPPPSDIFLRFVYLLSHNAQFLCDIWFSLKRLILGVTIAVPSAIIVGFAVGLNRRTAIFINPLIAITYPIPKLSILPFLMIIFGIGDTSKIAIIAIGIFYLVLLNVVHGIKGLSRVYFDIASVYRIPFMKRLFSVIFKGILPDILNGCKIGIGYGLVMVVAGEFIAAKNGIGFFMWNAWDQFRIKDLYVGFTFFSLTGLGIFALFDWLQARLKWRNKSHSQPSK